MCYATVSALLKSYPLDDGAYFGPIVLDCDLLVPINVLSLDEIFQGAINVNQEFLMLLVVLV